MLDEELTRKVLGCLQQSDKQLLRMQVVGQSIRMYSNSGKSAEIPMLMFYRMSVPEILEIIGIKANDKARNI